MSYYHNIPSEAMKTFNTHADARIHRKPEETTVPFGSLHGAQRWVNMLTADYIAARYSVRIAH
jgi:hypothetical protein